MLGGRKVRHFLESSNDEDSSLFLLNIAFSRGKRKYLQWDVFLGRQSRYSCAKDISSHHAKPHFPSPPPPNFQCSFGATCTWKWPVHSRGGIKRKERNGGGAEKEKHAVSGSTLGCEQTEGATLDGELYDIARLLQGLLKIWWPW